MPIRRPSVRAPLRRLAPPAALLCALAGTATACASRAAPTPETPSQPAPDLGGHGVMVLPAQSGAAARPPRIDDEIRYWLAQSGSRIAFVFPDRLRRALAASPALSDVRLDALAVASFRRGRVERIGDPLFGDLRRLGAVVDARYALLPVAAAYVPGPGGASAGRVEIAAALIDTFGGDVLWYGVVGGDRGPAGDARVVASAARALAKAVAR